MKKALVAVLAAGATLLASGASAAEPEPGRRPAVPVIIQADDIDPCGSGTVMGLEPHGDGFLAVKSGPGLGFERIDKLYNGEQVYVCGRRGDWLAVVYTRGGDPASCNVMTPWRRTMPYTGPCRSGWVHKNWIGDIAG